MAYNTGVTLGASPGGKTKGGLLYYADAGQGGLVAAQLIALGPGSYQLVSKGRTLSSHREGGAVWSVQCTGGEALELAQMQMRKSAGGDAEISSEIFSVPLSDCAAQWLHLNVQRSEEHTSELQSLMRISYAVLCLKQK